MPSRKNRSTGTEDGSADGPAQADPATVKLRLLQNAYVHGKLTKGGTVVEFTPEEATKRLKATQLWERL